MEPNTNAQALPATCMELQKDILNDGEFLKRDVAANHLSNYLAGIKDPNGINHNFGYLFGLNAVRHFMERISDYNNSSPKQLIEGIRVCPARNLPLKIGDVIPMEKIMDTLFLMPVLADGTDLYKLYEFTDDDIILGNPRPCPNECLMLSFL